MSPHVEPPDLERFTLGPLAEELRGRCEAVARLQGGHTHYEEERSLFLELAREKDLFLAEPPDTLSLPPSDEGNEHQVWFEGETATFLKATWPDFFGLRVIHRSDEDPRASPVGYLDRWHLHNQLFGDAVRFLGALDTPQGLRLIIRQPAIAGVPATEEQIRDFFAGNGWRPFRVDGELAFFDPVHHVAISDTHRGNLVLMDDGFLAPIDLRVERLSGSLLDTVIKLST
jgi:hypothetical protein